MFEPIENITNGILCKRALVNMGKSRNCFSKVTSLTNNNIILTKGTLLANLETMETQIIPQNKVNTILTQHIRQRKFHKQKSS